MDSQDRGLTDKICEIREICGTKWRVSKKNTDDTDDTDGQDRTIASSKLTISPLPLERGRG